jgi:hypothetical protein
VLAARQDSNVHWPQNLAEERKHQPLMQAQQPPPLSTHGPGGLLAELQKMEEEHILRMTGGLGIADYATRQLPAPAAAPTTSEDTVSPNVAIARPASIASLQVINQLSVAAVNDDHRDSMWSTDER